MFHVRCHQPQGDLTNSLSGLIPTHILPTPLIFVSEKGPISITLHPVEKHGAHVFLRRSYSSLLDIKFIHDTLFTFLVSCTEIFLMTATIHPFTHLAAHQSTYDAKSLATNFLTVTRATRGITRWKFITRGSVKGWGLGPLGIFTAHGILSIRP